MSTSTLNAPTVAFAVRLLRRATRQNDIPPHPAYLQFPALRLFVRA